MVLTIYFIHQSREERWNREGHQRGIEMLLYLGRCAGFDVVCDNCGFSEHLDDDDIFYARYNARNKGWRIRVEANVYNIEGGNVYLCPSCKGREESYPGKGD